LFQQGSDRRAEVDGSEVVSLDAAYCDHGLAEEFVATQGALTETDRCATPMFDVGMNGELVIQPCRPAILYFNVSNDKQASFGCGERSLVDPKCALPFCAGAFKVLEVIRVVHDATRIGILVIYANLEFASGVAAVLWHGLCPNL